MSAARDALAEALYSDAELGPGYMLREDCEHLADRIMSYGGWIASLRSEGAREVLTAMGEKSDGYIYLPADHLLDLVSEMFAVGRETLERIEAGQ